MNAKQVIEAVVGDEGSEFDKHVDRSIERGQPIDWFKGKNKGGGNDVCLWLTGLWGKSRNGNLTGSVEEEDGTRYTVMIPEDAFIDASSECDDGYLLMQFSWTGIDGHKLTRRLGSAAYVSQANLERIEDWLDMDNRPWKIDID